MSLKYKLPPGYEIREIPDAQFWDLWTRPAKKIFNDVSMFYRNAEVFTKQELAQSLNLNADLKLQALSSMNASARWCS